MLYSLLYVMMLIGFAGLSLQVPDLKMKVIGALLTLVNGILFWKF